MRPINENYSTVGIEADVRWWGKTKFVVHHNSDNIPVLLSGRIDELNNAVNEILEYINLCTGTDISIIRDDNIDIYDMEDGIIGLGWTQDIGNMILGQSMNWPATVDSNQTFVDNKIRMNRDSFFFKYQGESTFWLAVEVIVHEIMHTYCAGHTTMGFSIMYPNFEWLVERARLIPHAADLFYMNYLKQRKIRQNVKTNLDNDMVMRPALVRARGIPAHHDLHIPLLRHKDKAYAVVLSRQSDSRYRVTETIAYDEFMNNLRDFTLKEYVRTEDRSINLPNLYVIGRGNHKATLEMDDDGCFRVTYYEKL